MAVPARVTPRGRYGGQLGAGQRPGAVIGQAARRGPPYADGGVAGSVTARVPGGCIVPARRAPAPNSHLVPVPGLRA